MASEGPKFDTPQVDPRGTAGAVELPVLHEPALADSIPAALAAPARKSVAAKRAPVAAKPAAVRPVAAAAPVRPPVATPAPVVPEAPAVHATLETTDTPLPAASAAPPEKDTTMDTVNTATDKTQEQAQALFADANGRAKSAMEKGTKLLADINDFSKGNIEAVVESGKIVAKGAEDVARYSTDYAKTAVEKANAAARQFAAVKSPTEFMKLQSEIAKDAVDSMMAETAKFTESYLKLLGEIAQPLSNRVALAAEKMKIAA